MVRLCIAVLLALLMLVGCADGIGFKPKIEASDSGAATDPGGKGLIDASMSASIASDGGDAGGRVPCNQKDVEACDCKGTDKQGEQLCMFDKTSSRDGFLGPCENCPPPDKVAPDQCSDGDKNGTESDTDCGGANCDPCPLDSSCVKDTDCHFGTCMGGTCKNASTGSGGAGSTGGAPGGTGGAGGAVASCQGKPDMTPCTTPAVMCIGNLTPKCLLNNCLCLL